MRARSEFHSEQRPQWLFRSFFFNLRSYVVATTHTLPRSMNLTSRCRGKGFVLAFTSINVKRASKGKTVHFRTRCLSGTSNKDYFDPSRARSAPSPTPNPNKPSLTECNSFICFDKSCTSGAPSGVRTALGGPMSAPHWAASWGDGRGWSDAPF